jgi:hypothetical protein
LHVAWSVALNSLKAPDGPRLRAAPALQVALAVERATGRRVAVKRVFLRPGAELAALREARALQAAAHPNLVEVLSEVGLAVDAPGARTRFVGREPLQVCEAASSLHMLLSQACRSGISGCLPSQLAQLKPATKCLSLMTGQIATRPEH